MARARHWQRLQHVSICIAQNAVNHLPRCSTSYPANVNPNCGDDRIIRAGPPLKNALNPSSFQMVLAAWRRPVYATSPFRASTCNLVLMTSHGVVRYAAGIPAMAPALSICRTPNDFCGLSPNTSLFKWL